MKIIDVKFKRSELEGKCICLVDKDPHQAWDLGMGGGEVLAACHLHYDSPPVKPTCDLESIYSLGQFSLGEFY